MTMGERIYMLRKKNDMTQSDLAKRLGVGRSAVLKYEKGEVENLPRSTIEKMAMIFGVSPAYIMCFDEWDKNSAALSDEVMLIERIQVKWGKGMISIIQNYCELNEAGKDTLLSIAESLTELNKYKK
jgi:transcriptional regulator with XRE-family HTH domain